MVGYFRLLYRSVHPAKKKVGALSASRRIGDRISKTKGRRHCPPTRWFICSRSFLLRGAALTTLTGAVRASSAAEALSHLFHFRLIDEAVAV